MPYMYNEEIYTCKDVMLDTLAKQNSSVNLKYRIIGSRVNFAPDYALGSKFSIASLYS